MKQRITFIQPEGTGIDPNGIHVNPDTVVFSNARSAALEKRLTLGLEDLPAEVGMNYISSFRFRSLTNHDSRSAQSSNNATNCTSAGPPPSTTPSQHLSSPASPRVCTSSSRPSPQALK
jgi:hypothetical protein